MWPIATEIHIPWHVRYQVKSGLVVLNVSFVARDPEQTRRRRYNLPTDGPSILHG